jgi:ssDNA-binding Zn-finger/Zn-ribbon topoisomerase 1
MDGKKLNKKLEEEKMILAKRSGYHDENELEIDTEKEKIAWTCPICYTEVVSRLLDNLTTKCLNCEQAVQLDLRLDELTNEEYIEIEQKDCETCGDPYMEEDLILINKNFYCTGCAYKYLQNREIAKFN